MTEPRQLVTVGPHGSAASIGSPRIRRAGRVSFCATALTLALLSATGVAAQIAGQEPLLTVSGSFCFVDRAWSQYTVTPTAPAGSYRLWVATFSAVPLAGRPRWWLETVVDPDEGPAVVTRALVDETPDGPGSPIEVIVQVTGKAPFKVPRKYFRRDGAEAAKVSIASQVERGPERIARVHERDIPVVDVAATVADGSTVAAMVSTVVAPLGIVEAETPDVRMQLEDWGTDAHSRIDGKPVSFFRWVMTEALRTSSQPP